MNLIEQGLAMQAASIGKTLADYHVLKVPCPSCRGTLVDSQERSCRRCEATGFVEVKRAIVERKDEVK